MHVHFMFLKICTYRVKCSMVLSEALCKSYFESQALVLRSAVYAALPCWYSIGMRYVASLGWLFLEALCRFLF